MFIGIDVGATHIRIAEGEKGKFTSKEDFPTGEFKQNLRQIKEAVAKIASGRKVKRVGICVPGPFEAKTNKIIRAPRLKDWQNINLAKTFTEALQTQTVVAHDAAAAAFGEYIYGAGVGKNPVCYVTVSTGIGVGLIVNGQIYMGTTNPEAGHQILGKNGPKCDCGQESDLESYTGGAELEKRTGKKAALLEGSKIWKEAMECLGVGIINIILHYAPEIVVIGGGMTKNQKAFFPQVEAVIKKRLLAVPVVPIVPSRLGQDSGLIGCIALAEKG